MLSDDLLDQAGMLWNTSRKEYRDSMLRVGSLIRQFLCQRFKEAEGMNEEERRRHGASRAKLTRVVASRLSTTVDKVNELIRTSAVVSLLSLNGEVGRLSYSAIRYFRRLITRRKGELKRSLTGSTSGGLSLLEREEWLIRPEFEDAPRMFRQAVSENWNEATIRKVVESEQEFVSAQAKVRRSEDRDKVLFLRQAVQAGTPRDVADLLVSLIEQSSDPGLVRVLVKDRLLSPVRV